MLKDSRKRIAVIDYDLCNPEKCGYLCESACPINRAGKECIVHEEKNKPTISEELCTGCMICPKRCPFGAITIINLSLDLKQPIHQYGKNAFRLYRLPTPKEKKVLGLVGMNGCGKTTALNIIAGQLTPNLGDYGKKASLEKVVEHFKGKETQAYFKKIKEKKITLAYKPQNIEALSKKAREKIGNLLKKVDERGALGEIVKEMHLGHLLEREPKNLSGGELQKVAIAATLLKDAEVYFFDEPTSYLDVSERLNAAKALGKLALEKSVVVVEHDLAVLDYLSDYVQLFFGAPGAYGVISNPKTVKNGINEFLEGFLPDENLRFRASELKFGVKPSSCAAKSCTILEYPEMEKKFPGFGLKTSSGSVMEGEVLGILGANATGKTTFVKMLAGIEKPTKTEHNAKYSVSYKPQYLSAEKGIAVRELFEREQINEPVFDSEIKKRLSIEPLLEKQLEKLSGGELQRAAIALCLARDADLYLLDEPSAFLDAEQRLQAAQAIKAVVEKRKKAAFVVEHDILFQDRVSNRLVVFEGKPGVNGKALKPQEMRQGMNLFLKAQGITFRRDPKTGRPRANKPNSVLDKEQKQSGEYYYSK